MVKEINSINGGDSVNPSNNDKKTKKQKHSKAKVFDYKNKKTQDDARSKHEMEVNQKLFGSRKPVSEKNYKKRLELEKKEIQALGLKTQEEITKYYIEKDIKEGRLCYTEDHTSLLDDGPIYLYFSDGYETVGDLMKRYNIQDYEKRSLLYKMTHKIGSKLGISDETLKNMFKVNEKTVLPKHISIPYKDIDNRRNFDFKPPKSIENRYEQVKGQKD